MPTLDDLYPGKCILLHTPGHPIPHLWIILTFPDDDPEQVVAVNVTSKRWDSDPTCILDPDDHPFITRESVIRYSDARLLQCEPLLQALEFQECELHGDCSDELLEKVQRGLLRSELTPRAIVRYCAESFESDEE